MKTPHHHLRAPRRVVLDHGDLFRHVEGQVVFDSRAPAEGVFARFGENLGHKVLIFDEPVAVDPAP